MSEKESRVEALASQIESVNHEVMQAVEGCTDAGWSAVVEGEGWPVAALFDHVANGYKPVVNWAVQIANGEAPPPLTLEQINQFNDSRAEKSATVSKADVLALLQENGTYAAEAVRGLTDEQLDRSATVVFLGGRTLSAEALINGALINHARGHLQSVQETLGA